MQCLTMHASTPSRERVEVEDSNGGFWLETK